MRITEAYMPFLEYQTYYRVVGESHPTKKPLVLLHGGPGSTHNYFELLDSLAESGRQLIMYDQLGCGQSYVADRPDLWRAETWVAELSALIAHLQLSEFHLLGQSWGGMLAIQYLCEEQPTSVVSAILSSTLPSSQLWGQEQQRLIRLMSEADQRAIEVAIATNTFNSPAYLAANERFMERHSGDKPDEYSPEPIRRPKKVGRESYETAWGPNEFFPNGTLVDWDYRTKLPTIKVPSLIISGTDDLSTPLVAKTMADGIPNSRWELFAHSRHMPLIDEREKYLSVLNAWLTEHDLAYS